MDDKNPNLSFSNKEVIHQMEPAKKKQGPMALTMVLVVVIVGLGILTGYLLSGNKKGNFILKNGGSPKMIKSEKMAGSTDKKSFRDVAEGKLEKGGIDGEGSHKLIRPGGASQTVYLTSSVIDLDQYVGKKVRVWGETFAAQKAGWLMDIGRIEIL